MICRSYFTAASHAYWITVALHLLAQYFHLTDLTTVMKLPLYVLCWTSVIVRSCLDIDFLSWILDRFSWEYFPFSPSFLINCQTWRHIINLWQNVFEVFGNGNIKISFSWEEKYEILSRKQFLKTNKFIFQSQLFVETSNHKAAIHRSHVFFFKLTQLTKSPYLLKIISVNIFWVVTMKATVHFITALKGISCKIWKVKPSQSIAGIYMQWNSNFASSAV